MSPLSNSYLKWAIAGHSFSEIVSTKPGLLEKHGLSTEEIVKLATSRILIPSSSPTQKTKELKAQIHTRISERPSLYHDYLSKLSHLKQVCKVAGGLLNLCQKFFELHQSGEPTSEALLIQHFEQYQLKINEYKDCCIAYKASLMKYETNLASSYDLSKEYREELEKYATKHGKIYVDYTEQESFQRDNIDDMQSILADKRLTSITIGDHKSAGDLTSPLHKFVIACRTWSCSVFKDSENRQLIERVLEQYMF